MLHLGYLNYTRYQVEVSFKGLENITYEVKVKFVVGGERLPSSSVNKLVFLFMLMFTHHFFVSLLVAWSDSVENVQSHLLSGRNLVPVCLRGADLHGDGERRSFHSSALPPVILLVQ